MSTTTGADTAYDALGFALTSARPKMYVSASLVDDLLKVGIRPPARVISGDVEAVTAALAALPEGSVIEVDEQVFRANGPIDTSRTLAEQFVGLPITVLREGTGA